jgi:Zn-dependent peptidase ImmA (M78 family)/transcriptional regulator with XRE-family HTH domain
MTRPSVPITATVLRWAVKESGYSPNEVAEAAEVGIAEFTNWLRGDSLPTLGQARAVAGKLKRPLATLLLPAPPNITLPTVEFRRPTKGDRRQLNPAERLRLREAGRLQTLFAWINEELRTDAPKLQRFSIWSNPEHAAGVARTSLRFSIDNQVGLPSASAAWHAWREAVEGTGVYVIVVPIGLASCRGFSLWNERAPLIAINSSWNAEARSFTLIHEFAHLLTRTNSACLEVGARPTSQSDEVERWCERVAALVLIPDSALKDFVATHLAEQPANDLGAVSRVARQFKTSRRAAALRLIEAGYADWALYRSIPAVSERPRRGGGGAGRTVLQMRADRYGSLALRDVARAVRREIISTGDAFDYLGLPPIPAAGSVESGAFLSGRTPRALGH